jgi:hypothetical protein
MTEEQRTELRRMARNKRDNAQAELVVAAHFEEEYMAGITGSSTACVETHKRSLELYDFVIGGKRRANDFMNEALLFEAAAGEVK